MVQNKKNTCSGDLVVLHGDEMAQVAFEAILERFIRQRTAITLHEIDLSAKNRIKTNGKVVRTAIDALLTYGVGVKNAGITVNKTQLNQLIGELASEAITLDAKTLAPAATKSPNGAIRKGISGNIFREDIPFTTIKRTVPDWKNRDVVVSVMEHGGVQESVHGEVSAGGELLVSFTDTAGHTEVLHTRTLEAGDIYLLATASLEEVKAWAKAFFKKALDENRPAFMALKDTVLPGYDGVMKEAVESIFQQEFADAFSARQLTYQYGLIDAQAASMVVSPPQKALWGIPDHNTGSKMQAMVKVLTQSGMSANRGSLAVSRMSAGGGDQYGSFNAPAQADGTVTLSMGGKLLHSRAVAKGDPMMLMSNSPSAIRAWALQTFQDAQKKGQEVYVGCTEDDIGYEAVAAREVQAVYHQLAEQGVAPVVHMVHPAEQLITMVCHPVKNGCYAALNMDGDIFSDIAAALGGSLATASSIIASTDGIMLFEAPHGTAPDLYAAYVESHGKKAFFNPSALLYAVANALEVMADKQASGTALREYATQLKTALLKTVESGCITPDIKGQTTGAPEKVLDLFGFLDAVEARLAEV